MIDFLKLDFCWFVNLRLSHQIKNIKLKIFFYKSCQKRSRTLRFSWKRWSRPKRSPEERPPRKRSLIRFSRSLSLLSRPRESPSSSSEPRAISSLIRLISPRLSRRFSAIFPLTSRRSMLRRALRKSENNKNI